MTAASFRRNEIGTQNAAATSWVSAEETRFSFYYKHAAAKSHFKLAPEEEACPNIASSPPQSSLAFEEGS
jgi:hypothetical protein